MKAALRAALVLLCAACLATAGDAAAQAAPDASPSSSEVRMGQVLALSNFAVKDDVDHAAFEKFVREEFNPAWEAHVPGAQYLIWKGDRGVREGEYLAVYNFDTLERRDFYFPQEDAGPYPEADKATEPILPIINRYQDMLSAQRVYTDYVLVGRDKVQDLPALHLIGVHRLTIKAGMEAAFEAFVAEKLHPQWAAHVPGMRMFVLKGDRGINKGGYIALYTFEPASMRDAYFPQPGEGSAAWEEAFAPLEALDQEMISYFEHGEAYMDYVAFTDYVLIR